MGNLTKGVIAGFAATVVLSALLLIKGAMGLMPDLNTIAMLAKMTGGGMAVGWLAHFVIGTVLWGGLFVAMVGLLPGGSYVGKGLVFGIGAWLAMMILVMPMAGAGLFGLSLGIMAPIMTLVLHLIYGAVLGWVYGAQLPLVSRV